MVKKEKATKLTLNVFGFSRGSFYARVFCAVAKGDDGLHPSGSNRNNYKYPARKEIAIDAKNIHINFVGIYDTVSSHGTDHYNDPRTFPLDVGKAREGIKKIVHLTAQNDYRHHFPLTSVNQAIGEDIAFECSLPGAHSDLGGGYTDSWQEANHYLSYQYHKHVERENRREGEIDWRWWRERGYYKTADLRAAPPTARELKDLNPKIKATDEKTGKTIYKENPDSNIDNFRHIIAHRTVRHHYQYLSLNMMQLCAEKFGQLEFTAGNKRYKKRKEAFDQQKGRDPLLSKMDEEMTIFIEANYGKSGRYSFNSEQALGSKEASQKFYYTYIHNSLQPSTMPLYSDANCGSWNNQDDAGIPQRPTVRGG